MSSVSKVGLVVLLAAGIALALRASSAVPAPGRPAFRHALEVPEAGQLLSAATGLRVDWPAFADAWRAGYAPAMQGINAAREWVDIDTLHRRILDGP